MLVSAYHRNSRLRSMMPCWMLQILSLWFVVTPMSTVLLVGTRKEYWPLNDPAKATGTEEEIMQLFAQSYEDIRGRVAELIGRLRAEG